MIEIDNISVDPTKLPAGKKIFWQCSQCGNCCRWPGEVVVDDAEIEKIAAFLEVPVADFTAEYTKLRLNRTGLTLTERENGECVFLNAKGLCSINPVKPIQCAGFPNTWNFEGWQKVCEAKPTLINDRENQL